MPFFMPFFALLLTPFAAAFDDDAIPLAFGGLDALFLADARRAFLPAHAIRMGLRGQHRGRGHYAGGKRERIEYHSHVQILFRWFRQMRQRRPMFFVPKRQTESSWWNTVSGIAIRLMGNQNHDLGPPLQARLLVPPL
jgi:hypothetical protein